MAIVNGSLQVGYKDSAWFTANPTVILKEGQIVYLEQTGTYKLGDGVTQLSALTFLGGGGTVDVNTIGATINGATSATPNDTDLVMSVDASVAKKNTWTQIKAFLKTYFDTIYTTTSAVASQISSAISGKEDASNKSTNVNTDQASDTKYPSVKAVYDWAVGLFVKKGTLTTNYIPKATASDTIGNSSIYDNGTNVGIGVSNSPTAKLNVRSNGSSINDYVVKIEAQAGAVPFAFGVTDESEVFIGGAPEANIITGATNNIFQIKQGGFLFQQLSGLLSFGSTVKQIVALVTSTDSYTGNFSYHDYIIRTNNLDRAKVDKDGNFNVSNLTASQIVETDSSKNLVSAAKGTAYNKNFGTTAGTVLEGNTSRLIHYCEIATINPADSLTYYFGEYVIAPTVNQGRQRFTFDRNYTITKITFSMRQTVQGSNEAVAFYLQESGTTDHTIVTNFDFSSFASLVPTTFTYTPSISVTSGTYYEFKMVNPVFTTNPTGWLLSVKIYGY